MSRKMPRAMLPLWRCKSTSFLSSEVNMSECNYGAGCLVIPILAHAGIEIKNSATRVWLVTWLFDLRIYITLMIFQPYCDLEAGDN